MAEMQKTWVEASVSPDSSETIRIDAYVAATPNTARIGLMGPRLARRDQADQNRSDFELVQPLGQGGMGTIHVARQVSLDREVALKEIHDDKAHRSTLRQRFLVEAMVTGQLEHPGIIPVYEIGRDDDGRLFYTMQRVKGQPWSQVIGTKLRVTDLDILDRVCDAISYAHSHDTIHRDLKPANVMLGDFGEVYVLDWGLAASIGAKSKAMPVREAGLGGTPAYMAPELVRQEYGRMGVRTDVYLLGAILFEIATGRPPHAGGDLNDCVKSAMLNRIELGGASGELIDICMKAMTTDPNDRYPTVAAFQQALRLHRSHGHAIALFRQAQDELAVADKTGDHEHYAEAIGGYRQALAQWPEFQRAQRGLEEARMHYARWAMRRGDLDLAASLATGEGQDFEGLASDIAAKRDQRIRHQNRLRILVVLAIAAGILVVMASSGAALLINAARARTERALQQAMAANLELKVKTLHANLSASNPQYRGDGFFYFDNGEVIEADFSKARLEDLSPLAGLPLRKVNLQNTRVWDLTPLQGSPVAELNLRGCGAIKAGVMLPKLEKLVLDIRWQQELLKAFPKDSKVEILDPTYQFTGTVAKLNEGHVFWESPEQQQAAAMFNLPIRRYIPLSKTVSMEMVLIPPGDFISRPTGKDGEEDLPTKRVAMEVPYYAGTFEVTQAQYAAVTGINPSTFSEAEDAFHRPVEGVSGIEIIKEFLPQIQKLAPKGWVFKIPSLDEWEYACRGGSVDAYFFGNGISSDMANYNGRVHRGAGEKSWSRGQTTTVGRFPPNRWGLHDMHGNVDEWTGSLADGDSWERGGSFDSGPEECASSWRKAESPDESDLDLGFRVFLVLQ